ncbi:MAG: hypothetical protein WCC64_15305, partial [Aliidongia sp.]
IMLAAASPLRPRAAPRGALARLGLASALAALLITPTAWALSTVIGSAAISAPSASLALLVPANELTELRPRNIDTRQAPPPKLVAFLQAHRQNETFLAAVANSRLAAPLILATGQPVMAMGGFLGTDPILSPERLAELVAQNQLRYVLLGEPDTLDRFFGAQTVQKPLMDWVRANGRVVNTAEWQTAAADNPPLDTNQRRRGGDLAHGELYDLRPEPVS